MRKNDCFLKACRREPADRIPAWFMRQAGRYMQVYRDIREKHSFLDMVKQPDIAAEVTLQPVEAFDIDAAIIFADILPLLESMSLDLTFAKGVGPRIHNPIRTVSDIDRLTPSSPEADLAFTLEAIKLVQKELDGSIPLLGFSGAPFTLACYAIEGGGSPDYATCLSFMREEPEAFSRLMDKLTDAVIAYMKAQVDAGVNAVQLFDSWVGIVSPEEYREHVLPFTARVTAEVKQTGVPFIHFGTKTGPLLSAIRETQPDVIGIDAETDLPSAWEDLGNVAVQGNLDAELLLGPWEPIEEAARTLLDRVAGKPGFIFNLGHGIIKETDPDHIRRLADFVHAYQPS